MNNFVEVTNKVLKSVFGENAPVAKLDNDSIIVDRFSISTTGVTVETIRGDIQVLGFSLNDEDGILAVDRSFHEVLHALVDNVSYQLTEAVLDSVSMDEYVRQLTEELRLAQEG